MMRSLLFLFLVACSTGTKPADAGADGATDGAARCFPSPRGFDPGIKNGALTLSQTPLEAKAIALDHQGRILVGGTAMGMDSFVTRIGADGKVDTSFGDKGTFQQSLGAQLDFVDAIAVDAQDRVLLGGGIAQGNAQYPFVARLTAAGALDTTFQAQGLTPGVWLASISLGYTFALAADQGGLYAVGTSHFIQRLLDDGTPDPAFPLVQGTGTVVDVIAGSDGVVVMNLGPGVIEKYGKASGMKDPSFGGQVFAQGYRIAKNGTGFIAVDGNTPGHVALLDANGKVTGVSPDIAMAPSAIGTACDRIVLAGGSDNDAKIGLLGLDAKPVMGDIAVDSFPVAAPPGMMAGTLLPAVQPDGRVIFALSVIGTGSIEFARVSP